jgi:hypothetical protein
MVSHDGKKVEYDIFFDVTRATRKGGWLNLVVQSAYIRDDRHQASRPKARKISLRVIAYKRMMKQDIKPPP